MELDDGIIAIREYKGKVTIDEKSYTYLGGIRVIVTEFISRIDINFSEPFSKIFYEIIIHGIDCKWQNIADAWIRDSGKLLERTYVFDVSVEEKDDKITVKGDWKRSGKPFEMYGSLFDQQHR